MSSYKILNAQKINSKKLGVVIKPSKNKSKKIDVFKNEKKVATIGDSSYGDYHTYIKTKGRDYATKRKTAYKARHAKTMNKVGSPSYYANKIIWS